MRAANLHACWLLILSQTLPAQERPPRAPDPLWVAASAGDLAEMARLLDAGASPHGRTPSFTRSQRDGGDTLLHHLAVIGRLESMALLIERGAEVEAENRRGDTPLDVAFGYLRDDAVDLLLKAGAKIRTNTFLQRPHDPRRIARLFELGADADVVDEKGRTALHSYEILARPESLAVLVEHGASWAIADAEGNTPLYHAASARLLPALEIAKAAGALTDPRLAASDPARLLAAVVLDDAETLGNALAAGAEVDRRDTQGRTPLQVAAELGRAALAEKLIAAGASLSGRAVSPHTPLHLAAGHGHAETLVKLLGAGAPVSTTSDHIVGPALLWAARGGDLRCTETLLTAGSAVDGANDHGSTPLLAASEAGHVEVAALLLRAGADPERRGGVFGQTALHFAATKGPPELVDRLLAAGAAVDRTAEKPMNGDVTPLMAAVLWQHAGIVRRLLAAGADRSLRSPSGKTAIDFARDDPMRALLQ